MDTPELEKACYVYIASPFFKPKELAFVKEIEAFFGRRLILHYSPRSEGVLIDMTNEGKMNAKKKIFDTNIEMIKDAMIVVAVIDDRDVGTIWEMGYAHGQGIPVVSISNQDFGLNVMLAESVQAHVRNLDDLCQAIIDPKYTGELVKDVY